MNLIYIFVFYSLYEERFQRVSLILSTSLAHSNSLLPHHHSLKRFHSLPLWITIGDLLVLKFSPTDESFLEGGELLSFRPPWNVQSHHLVVLRLSYHLARS